MDEFDHFEFPSTFADEARSSEGALAHDANDPCSTGSWHGVNDQTTFDLQLNSFKPLDALENEQPIRRRSPSRLPEAEWPNFPELNMPCHNYSLRKPDPKARVMTTWLDQDKTGDYDPEAERAPSRSRRTKPKRRQHLIRTNVADVSSQLSPKNPCIQCEKVRSKCSVVYNLDHGACCEQCQEINLPCSAGPSKESINTAARLDRDRTKLPVPPPDGCKNLNPSLPCQKCKTLGRTCSYTYEESNLTTSKRCTSCDMEDSTCRPTCPSDPFDIQIQTSKDTPACHEVGNVIFPQADDDSTVHPSKRQRIQDPNDKMTMRTRLIQPLHFNHHATCQDPCYFCQAPFSRPSSLPILGSWLSDESHHSEVSAIQQNGTKICMACTSTRTLIIACENHNLTLIDGSKANNHLPAVQQGAGLCVVGHISNFQPLRSRHTDECSEYDEALEALFEGRPRPQDRWCSVCPSLAVFECVTPCEQGETNRYESPITTETLSRQIYNGGTSEHGPTSTTTTQDTSEGQNPARQQPGCGLQLCRTCMSTMVTASGNDLEGFLISLGSTSKGCNREDMDHVEQVNKLILDERPLGFRADWELLKEDGLLMRYLNRSLGMS